MHGANNLGQTNKQTNKQLPKVFKQLQNGKKQEPSIEVLASKEKRGGGANNLGQTNKQTNKQTKAKVKRVLKQLQNGKKQEPSNRVLTFRQARRKFVTFFKTLTLVSRHL